MNKYLLAVIATLALALAGLGYLWKSQVAQLAVAKSEKQVLVEALNGAALRLEKDRRILVTREAANAAQGRKLAQAQQALSEALQRNLTWSNTNVPPDVLQALQRAPAAPNYGSGGPNSSPDSVLNYASGEGATKPRATEALP